MSVFEFPGDIDDGENSPDSPEHDSDTTQAERKKPSDESQAVPDDSRIASLERQLGEVNENIMNLVAENAALKTKLKVDEGAEKPNPKYSPEELKSFSLEDEGTKQFDAAKLYADQAIENARTELMSELRRSEKDKTLREEFLELYPDLSDPHSEFSRSVENEKLRLMRRGLVDDEAAAYNVALHKVSRTTPPSRGNEAEYARTRRIEDAGGEGAPTKTVGPEDEPVDTMRLTKSDMEMGRRMGLNMDDKDVRKRILARKKQYESRRTR